jgi:hypothetical protein
MLRPILTMKFLPPIWLGLACTVFTGESRSIGQTWSQSNLAPKQWLAIASSAGGSNIAALAVEGLFTSTNSGQTWTTNIMPQLPWVGLASSADGSKLIAASSIPSLSQYSFVLTSTNFGISWTTSNVPLLSGSQSLTAVASSTDGNTLVVVGSYGRIYVSTNGNSSWNVSTNASYGFFSSVACSTDGKKIAVVRQSSSGGPGGILISTDWGLTWNPTTAPVLYWTALAFSAEEARLFACGWNFSPATGLYVTSNDGASWTQLGLPDRTVRSLAVSADGQKLAISTAKIFTSSNGGTDWITNSVPNASAGWLVASSADGGNLAAANLNSRSMYFSGTFQPPVIRLDYGSGVSKLSWVVPSMNFVLEQTGDFDPAIWSPITTLPYLNLSNLHHEITLPATGGNRFFRLRAE